MQVTMSKRSHLFSLIFTFCMTESRHMEVFDMVEQRDEIQFLSVSLAQSRDRLRKQKSQAVLYVCACACMCMCVHVCACIHGGEAGGRLKVCKDPQLCPLSCPLCSGKLKFTQACIQKGEWLPLHASQLPEHSQPNRNILGRFDNYSLEKPRDFQILKY